MNEKNSARVISLAALLSAAVSPSLAQTPQNQASASACYVPGSGIIYLVGHRDTPASCKAEHVEFTFGPSGSALKTVMAAAGGANGLTTNSQGAFDLSNVDGLVASGTWGTGNIPVNGAGTRLMWYPRMAALRAGIVSGTQWDAANVGSSSAAFGANTTASGVWSFAAGSNSSATGMGSFAIGFQSIAGGNYSAAMGYQAVATGVAAASLGSGTTAAGLGSVALGKGAEAHGENSVAIGMLSEAWGDHSTAMRGGKATASSAMAIGSLTLASGTGATAIGYSAIASGIGSMALGHHASTNGKLGTFVYGDYSTAALLKATADNQFVVRAQKFWLGNNNSVTATAGRLIETSTGAYLSSGGAWVSSSDSTKKHRWQDINVEDILKRLSTMPVRSWSYREEGDSVRHLGPTAQDFRTAFGLGDTDKAIATVDADGVSLAAIKALVQRTDDLRRENDVLRTLLGEVLRRLTALETGRR